MSVRFKNRKSVGNHTVARSRMEAFALPYLEERATQKPTQIIYIHHASATAPHGAPTDK